MTLIDKAEALEILELAEHDAEERDWRSGANEVARIRKRIAALPARGVGVPTIDELANIIRMVDGQNSLGASALAEAILAALAPTNAAQAATDTRPANCRFRLKDEGKPYGRSSCSACGKNVLTGLGNSCSNAPTPAAHVNETPKSEHDAGNVLTDAAQAREAALRDAIDRLRKAPLREGANPALILGNAHAIAVLEAMIGETRA